MSETEMVTMNAAEMVTMRWLASKGYFVMPAVKGDTPYGRNEFDILAVKVGKDNLVEHRVHVEVSVAPNPYQKAEEKMEKEADDWVRSKFDKAADCVRRHFGGNGYDRWAVWNNDSRGVEKGRLQDERMLEQHRVKVIRFDELLREYVPTLRNRPSDGDVVGQLLHILKCMGLLNLAPKS